VSEFAIARARHVAEFGTPGELCTWLIRACKEVDRLEAENAKLRAVVEAAKFLVLSVRELQSDADRGLIDGHATPISALLGAEKTIAALETTNG